MHHRIKLSAASVIRTERGIKRGDLREVKGKAKPYQVKQLLDLAERYNLTLGGEE